MSTQDLCPAASRCTPTPSQGRCTSSQSGTSCVAARCAPCYRTFRRCARWPSQAMPSTWVSPVAACIPCRAVPPLRRCSAVRLAEHVRQSPLHPRPADEGRDQCPKPPFPCCCADLAPLRGLPHLQTLHVEAEALPPLVLAQLPCSLRQLSLSCFANSARVSLPRGLLLDSLTVSCPGQPVFLGLGRALAQCRRVHVTGRSLRLLLQVCPGWACHQLFPAQQRDPVACLGPLAPVARSVPTPPFCPGQGPHNGMPCALCAGTPHDAGLCRSCPPRDGSRPRPPLSLFVGAAGAAAPAGGADRAGAPETGGSQGAAGASGWRTRSGSSGGDGRP